MKIGQLKYHLKEDETADEIVSEIVDQHLSRSLDLLVAKRMDREVLLEALGMTRAQAVVNTGNTQQVTVDFDEEIADLGDNDPDQPEQTAIRGGLTDADLKKDMEVDDPEHEAKSDALTVDLSGPEDFAAAAGMLDPRIERRKKRFTPGKAKVSLMTTDHVEEKF